MSKYIDIEWLKKKKRFDSKQQRYIVRMTDIYSAPSIDIVRCKECKHWDTKWIPSGEDDDVHWCSWKDLVEYGDWFCADGEREGE